MNIFKRVKKLEVDHQYIYSRLNEEEAHSTRLSHEITKINYPAKYKKGDLVTYTAPRDPESYWRATPAVYKRCKVLKEHTEVGEQRQYYIERNGGDIVLVDQDRLSKEI